MDLEQKKVFAERLGKLRTKQNLSQQQLSEETNINRETIAKYETVKRIPSYEHLTKFAKYFQVSTDYLLGISDNFTPDDKLQFVCNYTGLHENAINRISTMKNYCMNYDGTQINGTKAFEALNEYLISFASENVSVYIAKMKEINEDYLLHCLIQCIYKDDRHKCGDKIPIKMACFEHQKLSNDIKEKSEKCDMSYFRASKAYENFLKEYNCNNIGEYYEIKDIYERLHDTFGYTKEQIDKKIKDLWKKYDSKEYKQWQP